MIRRCVVMVMSLVAIVAGVAVVPAGATPVGSREPGGVIVTRTLTNGAGTRAYQVYTPAGLGSRAPLIVWLHGASKVKNGDPQELRRDSTLLREADRRGYAVVAPMQSLAADAAGTWRIGDPATMTRGGGEASIIADIVRRTIRDLHADRSRVYVVGHSAGGAMTANVAALYPELFAGIAIVAGLPYLADPTGTALRAVGRGYLPMPTYVVMGDRDTVIPSFLGDFATSAALGANGITGAPARVLRLAPHGLDRYPVVIRSYGSGRQEVVYAQVIGATHPVGPGRLTVGGPALDRRVLGFLLSKRR